VLDFCTVRTFRKYLIYFINYSERDVGFYFVKFLNPACLVPCLLILCEL
jgi:hypothetical protein